MMKKNIKSWRVPADGIYQIELAGACNKGTQTKSGGFGTAREKKRTMGWPTVVAYGACVRGDFELKRDDTLDIRLGKRGNRATDGCGASYLYHNEREEMLIVAGGAGGVAKYTGQSAIGANASFTLAGACSDVASEDGIVGGGGANHMHAGGGGGLNSGPVGHTLDYIGPLGFADGIFGGYYQTTLTNGTLHPTVPNGGGYGGGGYGPRVHDPDRVTKKNMISREMYQEYGAGGGGGYSGGDAGLEYGGGGGSFINQATNEKISFCQTCTIQCTVRDITNEESHPIVMEHPANENSASDADGIDDVPVIISVSSLA